MEITAGMVTAIVCTGMLVVFLALILLVVLIKFFGLASGMTGKQSGRENQPANVQEKTTPKAAVPIVAAQPVTNGVHPEVVAAISAAVHAIGEETGTKLTVTGIRPRRNRKATGRSAWGMAGVQENTRAF